MHAFFSPTYGPVWYVAAVKYGKRSIYLASSALLLARYFSFMGTKAMSLFFVFDSWRTREGFLARIWLI